ncbi:MAG: hypothetical protein ACO1NO_03135 [Burkholderiaceae bacterium]
MHLIQIFLPMYDNQGQKFPASHYRQVRDELMEKFNGITAYTRSPAHGLWQLDEGQTVRDDLVIYEVMVEELDRSWWHAYKLMLEQRFEQLEMLIRAQKIDLLK